MAYTGTSLLLTFRPIITQHINHLCNKFFTTLNQNNNNSSNSDNNSNNNNNNDNIHVDLESYAIGIVGFEFFSKLFLKEEEQTKNSVRISHVRISLQYKNERGIIIVCPQKHRKHLWQILAINQLNAQNLVL